MAEEVKSISFKVPIELAKKLDEYRFEMRISRSEALRQIINYFFWARENMM